MPTDGPLEVSAIDPALILGHIADALVLLAPDGTVLYANDAFGSMVGRAASELEGLRWSDFADSEVCARLAPTMATGGDRQVHFNFEFRAPGGQRKTYYATSSQVRDAAGQTIGILQDFCSMDRLRDMLFELKDVNDVIQREKDLTSSVMDSIGDGIFTVDRELVIRSFSTKMERLTGVNAADAIGRPCRDVLRGTKCDSDCPLRSTLDHGRVVERCREAFHVHPDRPLPVSVTTAVLHGARGEVVGMTGVIRDDSEVERLRAALQAATSAVSEPQAAATEADALRIALEQHRWNETRTATSLGISRTTLWRRMRRFGLIEPRK